MSDVKVTLTYTECEAREVVRAVHYFDSNVTATYEDHDRLRLIRSAIQSALPKPRPDEPTGLGAVVEVESQYSPGEKRRLVRTHNTRQPWFGDSIKQAWDEIPGPITILSEGTP